LSNSLFNNHTDHHHTLKTAAVSFSLPRMQRSHFQKGLRLSIGLRRSIPSGTSLTSVPSFKSAPPRSQVRSEERSRIYINMSCFLLKTSSSFAKTGSGQTCHQKDFKNTGVFSSRQGSAATPPPLSNTSSLRVTARSTTVRPPFLVHTATCIIIARPKTAETSAIRVS
jgi:hypothetical protein